MAKRPIRSTSNSNTPQQQRVTPPSPSTGRFSSVKQSGGSFKGVRREK
jgi:hypothetical protein